MSSEPTQPTQRFDLTTGQLTTLRFVIDRSFSEFLEYARDRTRPPGETDRFFVDRYMELCEVFGVEIPQVPDRPEGGKS